MATPGVSGFQATLEVDDGGTGGASGGISTKFAGLVTLTFPGMEAGTFDATEIDQVSVFEVELPTGTIKVGKLKGEIKFTKANYQRLVALNGKRGYTFKLTAPDDLTTPGTPVKMIATFTGFISNVEETKVDRASQIVVPFQMTPQTGVALT